MVDVLVTGGAGFIGSHFVRHALAAHADWGVTTLDTMSDVARVDNLLDVLDHPRHQFVRGSIADAALTESLLAHTDVVVHFAAETGTEPGIENLEALIENVNGTFVLLDAARRSGRGLKRFIQVSPDDVYGRRDEGECAETDELKPENPHAACKAGADRLAYSFWPEYRLPVTLVRAARTYGPCQGAGHLMPSLIARALDNLPLWLPCDGLSVRDWLHVRDHCLALDTVIEHGEAGEVYNIGGGHPLTDIELARAILRRLGRPETLIECAGSGPGRRCCLDTARVRRLGWRPTVAFDEGLTETIAWYAGTHA